MVPKVLPEADITPPSGTSTPLRTGTSTPLPLTGLTESEPEFEELVEQFTIADIITRHLARIQVSAQHYLGHPPSGAVYTVPTNFSSHQREELKKCSEKAGIPVLQIIHEPTAALLAWHSSQNESTVVTNKKYLVLDVGGIRADAAVIAFRGGMYTILSTSHAYDFAPGEALDKVLYKHFSAEFKKRTKLDTDQDPRARMKLLLESEAVKKSLSASTTANISVESLMDGIDFKSSINRVRFDLLARKAFQEIADFALKAVQKASIEPIDIDNVLSST